MAGGSGVNRDYTFSDGELLLFVNNLSTSMTRDLSEFGSYGVSSLKIDNLIDLSDVFQALPSDDLMRTDLSYEVEQKNAKMNIVLGTMRSISARAKAVFGENSSKYRSMSPGNISQLTDSELLLAAGQVHDAAAANQAALDAEGVTVLYLSDFQTAIQDYEDALTAVGNKKMIRDDSTEERILKGNELYGYVVKYCDYGKAIWDGLSQAKYNDYIIYTGGSTGIPGKIQNVAYNQLNNQITWDANPIVDTYQVEISDDEATWVLEYEGTDANAGIGKPPGTWYARVRGINDKGNGAWSDTLEYNVIILPPEMIEVIYQSGNHRVIVDWQATPYCDKYEVWNSEVALGQPAGTFTKLAEPTNHNYYHTTYTEGNRNYYYVVGVSISLSMSSEPSSQLWVDVPV